MRRKAVVAVNLLGAVAMYLSPLCSIGRSIGGMMADPLVER
jgi:hypothetical protein